MTPNAASKQMPAMSAVAAEVHAGLTQSPKTLSPWLFYDAEGSALFERITELPEYYPTRLERGLFERHADEMLEAAGAGLTVIELGAGTAAKTGVLLRALCRRQMRVEYHPIDVSKAALDEAEARLSADLPGVAVRSHVGDYTEGLGRVPDGAGRRLVLYIGSSIGNFEPLDAIDLLRGLHAQLRPGDAMLLGTDLRKDPAILIPAYDDAAGVTARFNKNVLARINRELGGRFDLDRFRHVARWNADRSRVEMHLESVARQRVAIDGLDLVVPFETGETIHTENSYKFTPATVAEMLRCGGFLLERTWTDADGWFAEHLARVV